MLLIFLFIFILHYLREIFRSSTRRFLAYVGKRNGNSCVFISLVQASPYDWLFVYTFVCDLIATSVSGQCSCPQTPANSNIYCFRPIVSSYNVLNYY